MDLGSGYPLEVPLVLIPWTVTQAQLQRLLQPHGLRRVGDSYFTLSCTSLGGLAHEAGFHFGLAESDRLARIEIFLRPAPGVEESYPRIQAHLEAAFGRPLRTEQGSAGFPNCTWMSRGVRIEHGVMERFGLSERCEIWPRP